MVDGLVIDASVVAKLYLRDEQHVTQTDTLFKRFKEGQVHLVAPRIITYEVPAAIKKGVQWARTPDKVWRDALSSFESLGLVIVDDSKSKQDAIKLSLHYSCHYYDALYLLLAEDLGWNFITAEDKLIRNISQRVNYVFPLANYK